MVSLTLPAKVYESKWEAVNLLASSKVAMNAVFEKDQKVRPELFQWNGPVSGVALSQWLKRCGLKVPTDLFDLWERAGGGDLFETEVILSPFAAQGSGAGVEGENKLHQERGLPADFLLFHFGSALSAVRQADGAWLVLNPENYQVLEEYASFADWYEHVIHDEFAARYGLTTAG